MKAGTLISLRSPFTWFRVALAVALWQPSPLLRAGQVLPGHVSAAVRGLTPVGELSSTSRLDLAIGLPLRHQAELSSFLKDLYDPEISVSVVASCYDICAKL